ncbi:MAG: O-antigen ligase family protein [Planctomycetaceae bacterium]
MKVAGDCESAGRSALWLLVVGQLVAFPQLRGAINMGWEWIAAGVAFVLLRQLFDDDRGRTRLLKLLAGIAILLAGLGLWQRYVWYPQMAADYLAWESLDGGGAVTAADRARLEELRLRLGPDLLALQGSSRLALRQRVLESTEPFGRFALANSFGGLLATLLLLLFGVAIARWRASLPARRLMFVGLLLLVAVTLLLTKSRTAWVGTAVGIVFILLSTRVARPEHAGPGRMLRWMGPFMLVAVLIGVAALATGLIDQQVLTEAPKSLLYRFQYWRGTLGVIAEHPWLGVGGGNFRQHYLRYKLPEASEEIADPHNLVLDVWANGGLIALAGLLWLMVIGLRSTWRSSHCSEDAAPPDQPERARTTGEDTTWLTLLGLVACAATFVEAMLFRGRIDEQVLLLGLLWLPICWLVNRLVPAVSSLSATRFDATLAAASLALTLHLCGAGGIAMPAILQLWLIVGWVLPGRTVNDVLCSPRFETSLHRGVAIAVGGIDGRGDLDRLAAGVSARIELRSGRYAERRSRGGSRNRPFHQGGHGRSVRPRSVAGTRFRARFAGTGRGRGVSSHITAAEAALRRAIELDRYNAHRWAELGQVQTLAARRGTTADEWRKAVESLRQATTRYPHSARLHAELAIGLAGAGNVKLASEAAARALELDDITRAAGHVDKFLSDEQRAELRAMLLSP